ncbi:hypothetical protein DFAR_1350006 [Desulfarculales bacterium]
MDLVTSASPEVVSQFDLDPGIGVFSSYRAILTCIASLMHQASFPDANLCLVFAPAQGHRGLRRAAASPTRTRA